ncbi:hypothetical protein HID58_022757 [Brassica napus]|uniref:Secreted protein n=1 Tax=Brassica napus TaxID=3708 RepID=A0ABQ8D058_BRANA|nr:hypothetical protein HID58_022757 [Brassica napus]
MVCIVFSSTLLEVSPTVVAEASSPVLVTHLAQKDRDPRCLRSNRSPQRTSLPKLGLHLSLQTEPYLLWETS